MTISVITTSYMWYKRTWRYPRLPPFVKRVWDQMCLYFSQSSEVLNSDLTSLQQSSSLILWILRKHVTWQDILSLESRDNLPLLHASFIRYRHGRAWNRTDELPVYVHKVALEPSDYSSSIESFSANWQHRLQDVGLLSSSGPVLGPWGLCQWNPLALESIESPP